MFNIGKDLLSKIKAALTPTQLQPVGPNYVSSCDYTCGSSCDNSCCNGCRHSCSQVGKGPR